MRFTKEFKLECIRKYKSGELIDDPGGCKHSTFGSHFKMGDFFARRKEKQKLYFFIFLSFSLYINF